MRTITGTIVDGMGQAWANAEVTFHLLSRGPVATAEHTVLQRQPTATTDENGDFSVSLEVPESGAWYHQCEYPNGQRFTFSLAAGDAVAMESLILAQQATGAAGAEDALLALLATHTNKTNPHGVTAAQTGAEPDLGDPSVDGSVLERDADGTSSWAARVSLALAQAWAAIQTFSAGIVTGVIRSSTDGTGAIRFQSSAGGDVFGIDTTASGAPHTFGERTKFGLNAAKNVSSTPVDAFGNNAGSSSSGSYGAYFGKNAGENNSANSVIFSGFSAGKENSGSETVGIGVYAGMENTEAGLSAMGHAAGYQNTGEKCTLIGFNAGTQNTGDHLTAIGSSVGFSNSVDHRVVIGNELNPILIDGIGDTTEASSSLTINAKNFSLPHLPTSDPTAAGEVWNDNGVLKISAG